LSGQVFHGRQCWHAQYFSMAARIDIAEKAA
jgi:hypothetical protein